MDRRGASIRRSGLRPGRRERELAAGHVADRRRHAPASDRVDDAVHDPGRHGPRSASQLDAAQKTELVLGGLPLPLYESFVQVIVPILQSRERANLQVFKRQALVYGRPSARLPSRDEAHRGRGAGAVAVARAGDRGELAHGRIAGADGGDGSGGAGSADGAEAEEEWEREKGMRRREKVDLERLNVFSMKVFVGRNFGIAEIGGILEASLISIDWVILT